MSERLVVVCRITERCNLGCAFCGYDRGLTWPRRQARLERLLALGARVAAFRRQSGREVLLSWLGGEPLLWPSFRALGPALAGALALPLGVTTNGTALGSPALRAHLVRHYAEVTVSVDGVGDTHDRLRQWPGGFARLARWIPALAEEKRRRGGAGPVLRANVVLMRDNVGELPALAHALAGWGIDEITVNQLGGNDRPEFFPAHHLAPGDVERLVAVLPGLRAELRARGVRLRGAPSYFERLRASAGRRALPVLDCAPGERFLFATEEGRLSPCSFSEQPYGVPLDDVAGLDALPARFRAAAARARFAGCDDCHSTQVFGKFREEIAP